MSDEVKTNKGELIPSINGNLVPKKSSLVERGLELISRLNKQELKIAFADYQGGHILEVLYEFIRSEISEKYDIKDRWSCYGDDLLEFAETSAVDIFILNLNCITNSSDTLGLHERLEYSYKIITQIKTRHPTPLIIALSGWPHQAERAKFAGADFYFEYPFKLEDFMKALDISYKRK